MIFTKPTIVAAAATHVGRVRDHNEDAVHVGTTVFAVADGMGGHAAGEVASGIAVAAIAEIADLPDLTVARIVDTVTLANRRILASAARHPEQTGMGTTIAGLALVTVGNAPHWAVFNLGDSRVYRFLDGWLRQVSVDHSEVGELLDAGLLTPAEARVHPARNVVTRSLGRDPMCHVDTWVFPPYAGERFVMGTDGLSNELEPDEIAALLRANPDPARAAHALVAAAVAAGGRDNVAVVVVDYHGTGAAADDDTTPRSTLA